MPKGFQVRESGIYDRIMSFRSPGESIRAYSQRCGLPRKAVDAWENKRHNGIGILNIQRFVKKMHVSYDWLIDGKESDLASGTIIAATEAVDDLRQQLDHLEKVLTRGPIAGEQIEGLPKPGEL